MTEPRVAAQHERPTEAFAWPPRRTATSPPVADESGRRERPPLAAPTDWMAVFDSEVPDTRSSRPRRAWPVRVSPRVASPRVIVPLLSAIVAAQAIALVLFVRQPVTVAALPPGPAPTPPVKASAIVAPEATSGVAEVRPTDTALSVDGEAGAAVFIDGRRSGVAPLKMTGLTAGRHQVRLSTTIGTATQDVTIAPGSSTSLIFPSPGSGWIDLRIPFRVSVFEGSRQVAVSGDGPISLPAGTHTLTLRNDDLGFRSETRVTVSGGRMAAVRPVLPDGVLQVNALPWANVYVDGEPVGDTPIGQLRIAVGPHEVRVVHPQLGERVQRVDVPAQRPARVSVDLR